MADEIRETVTRLLAEVEVGKPPDSNRHQQLFEAVYPELRRFAANIMRGERVNHTLQPTALVHEAYLRLLQPGDTPSAWENRRHFFGAAAEAMRRILIERARRYGRIKHGGEQQRVDAEAMDDVAIDVGLSPDEILALDSSLEALEARDPRKAEVVKLRFFAGLEIKEVAEVLNVSPNTVKNDWAFARAWLHERLRPDGRDG
jgi:RNA polymerase sigma factor (TIGR02999 family)